MVSEDRQRKSVVLQIVRKNVPSGRAGVAECTSSICRQLDSWYIHGTSTEFGERCILSCSVLYAPSHSGIRDGAPAANTF